MTLEKQTSEGAVAPSLVDLFACPEAPPEAGCYCCGLQFGFSSFAVEFVSRTWPVPSAFMTYR